MTTTGLSLSPVTMLNAAARLNSAQVTSDLPFGRNGQRLDLYSPLGGGTHPVAVFFYGGGWESGSRSMYGFLGRSLAAAGVLTVIADYRVYPEVKFPDFLADAADAVRWAHDNAGRFGGDIGRLILMGHSAGAHIAAMLAFDRQWLTGVGLDRKGLAGLIGLAGPYDFLPLRSAVLKTIFGPDAGLAATQPINFVERGACPVLLAAGNGDRVVDPANSVRLRQRLADNGVAARLVLYPRLGHEALIGAFAKPLRWLAPVRRDCLAFIAGLPALSAVAHPHEATA